MNPREDMSTALTDDWAIYGLKDAYAPRPRVQYVVSGLLRLPSLSIMYGAPGTLKSMLLTDMAICVASGKTWLSTSLQEDKDAERPTLESPVLLCDFDNGQLPTHERVEALARARNLPEDTPLHYVSMPSPWLDASRPSWTDALTNLVKSLGVRLVIIDNLRDISGVAEENSAEMGNVMSNLRRLAEYSGAAVVVIHHQRKSRGVGGRSGDALRGHSSIEAALDLALLAERRGTDNTVRLRPTKVRGAEVKAFAASFDYQHKKNTQELTEARFSGVLAKSTSKDARIRRTILDVVKRTPGISKGQLVKAVKQSVPTAGVNLIRGRVEELAGEGALTVTIGNHGAKLYDIPK
jgi:hypothetical protein